MPITITGPLKDSNGDLVTGEVKFRPLPFSGGKGTAKTNNTTTLVSGAVIAQQFTDGEPDFSEDSGGTLDLYAGSYEVRHTGTKPYTITCPSGDATRSIAELVTADAEGLPSVELGMPTGGTTGQALIKQSESDGDADWQDIAASAAASDTVVAETAFGQASTAGVSSDFSRADHTHGTPATPSAADVGADPAGTAASAVSSHAGGTGVHSIAGVAGLQAALDALMDLAIQVTALPASPTRGQVYELTQSDATALAAPGYYIHDGTGWFCLAYSAPYDLGNLTGAVSKTLIAGLEFTATATGNITSLATALTRAGRVGLTLTNASGYTVAQPTMAGRTAKLLSSTAWDDAAGALVKVIIEDDGTYLWASASEGA